MKCSYCGKEILEKNISSISHDSEGKLVIKCRDCLENLGFRNATEVMVVPVKKENLIAVIKTRKYYYPMDYKRRGGFYIAFYSEGKIKYYAKVKKTEKNVPFGLLPYNLTINKMKVSDKTNYLLYTFDSVLSLEKPIKREEGNLVRNVKNTTLKKLLSARTMGEL